MSKDIETSIDQYFAVKKAYPGQQILLRPFSRRILRREALFNIYLLPGQ